MLFIEKKEMKIYFKMKFIQSRRATSQHFLIFAQISAFPIFCTKFEFSFTINAL